MLLPKATPLGLNFDFFPPRAFPNVFNIRPLNKQLARTGY